MRVLILGATGMLGHVAIRVLNETCAVEATVRDRTTPLAAQVGVPLHELDASAGPAAIDAVLDAARPDVVLNCIGIVKQRPEASDPLVSITVNSLFPHQAAAACAARSLRLIHVSTDCVFSGRLEAPAAYRELDVPDPMDLYGRSKLLGEPSDAPALTIRTSIIGPELDRASGLVAWLESQAGQSIRGFRHAIFSGLTTEALAGVLSTLIHRWPGLHGLYHVSAAPISKLELVTRLNEAMELGCSIEPVDEPHMNRALDSARFRAETGIEVPSWTAMIADQFGKDTRAAHS